MVLPLEVLRAAHESGRHDLPLELIIFAEEEGTTFGMGMLGSLGWTGRMNAAQLDSYHNAASQSYLAAGKPFGVAPERLAPNKDAEQIVPSIIAA